MKIQVTAGFYRLVSDIPNRGLRLEKREVSITEDRKDTSLLVIRRILRKVRPEGAGWKVQSFGWEIIPEGVHNEQ